MQATTPRRVPSTHVLPAIRAPLVLLLALLAGCPFSPPCGAAASSSWDRWKGPDNKHLSVMDTTATSVTFHWDFKRTSADKPIKSYNIKYQEKGWGGGWKLITEVVPPHTVLGLRPLARYRFQVEGVLDDIRTLISNYVDVATDKLANVTAPRNLKVKAENSTTVKVSWDKPDIVSEDIQGYKILYGVNQGDGLIFWQQHFVNGTDHHATISNLTKDTSYTFTMLAFSTLGEGPMSRRLLLDLRSGVSITNPLNLKVNAENSTTVQVSWDEPEINKDLVLAYTVFYTHNPSTRLPDWHRRHVNRDHLQMTISNLTENNTYTFKIMASTVTRWSPLSNPVQVDMPPKPVERIAPKFSRVLDEVRLKRFSNLNLTCGAEGSPTPTVRWRQGTEYLGETDKPTIGLNVLTLIRVTHSGNYTCEASSDLGSVEHTVQVIVEASVPMTGPRNVQVKTENSTAVKVSWDEPEITNGAVEGYEVFYTLDPRPNLYFGQRHDVKGANRRATIISNLKENKTYMFVVGAYSKFGSGPVSRPITVEMVDKIEAKAHDVRVQNVKVVGRDGTTLVTWDMPFAPRSLTGFKIIYRFKTKQGRPVKKVTSISARYDQRPTWQVALVNLRQRTRYTIQVQPILENGIARPSKKVSFKRIGSPSELSIRAQVLGTRTALISYSVLGSGQLRNPRLFYCEDGDTKWRRVKNVNKKDQYAILTRLRPRSTYFFAAKARLGKKQKEAFTHLVTPPSHLHPVSNVTVSRRDNKSIEVTWVHNTRLDVKGYQVTVEHLRTRGFRIHQEVTAAGNKLSAVVLGVFTPFNTYQVEVTAFDLQGRVEAAEPVLFWILEGTGQVSTELSLAGIINQYGAISDRQPQGSLVAFKRATGMDPWYLGPQSTSSLLEQEGANGYRD